MATFSLEQLNFFKFSSVVLDEFPIALRHVFVHMWDNQVAPTPGFQKWDDSPLVRNMFLSKEGGRTKYVPTGKSYHEWDCTALFEATLYAQSFAIPDGSGGLSTLNKLYVKPRHLLSGTFHPVLLIPGNEAETFALALDQLRLLRNALCHQTSTQKIDKTTFDYYIKLAREALAALKQDTTRIDEIGKLEEEDFPTARAQKLEGELKKEKDVDITFKQINDHLNQIESQIETVRSDVKISVTDVQTKVEEVRSDVKTAVTDVQTKVEEVRSDIQTTVTDVQTKVEEVKTAAAEVETKLENVESEVKIATSELAKVKANVDDVKQAVQSGIKKGM
ncbi:uncharacterized protein [Porites lutea]|uniref:uncharacterized protein n=1 Tax=Porites lutea TaxID=51062 RepID=UPI003CC5B62D